MHFSAPEEAWFGDLPEGSRQAAAVSVSALVAKAHGVRPLPDAIHKLMEITADGEFQLKDVARIIEGDTTLASRVLRLVNSAAFALKAPCKSIAQAVAMIGTRTVREIATATAIFDMLDSSLEQAKTISAHMTMVAGICRILAPTAGLKSDDAYTCGLLHDVGKLMFLQVHKEEYARLLDVAGLDTIHHAERETYGFDHSLLAGHVLSNWRLPEPVPTVVRLHHARSRAYDESQTIGGYVALIHLAERIVDAVCGPSATSESDVSERLAQEEVATYLGISSAILIAMWPRFRKACGYDLEGGENDGAAMPAPVEEPVRKEVKCHICRSPAFGQQCARCHRNLCGQHDPGQRPWCSKCDEGFKPWQKKRGGTATFLAATAAASFAISILFGLRMDLAGHFPVSLGALSVFFMAIVLFGRERFGLRARYLRHGLKTEPVKSAQK